MRLTSALASCLVRWPSMCLATCFGIFKIQNSDRNMGGIFIKSLWRDCCCSELLFNRGDTPDHQVLEVFHRVALQVSMPSLSKIMYIQCSDSEISVSLRVRMWHYLFHAVVGEVFVRQRKREISMEHPNVENRCFWIYKYEKNMICVLVCVSLSRVISTERSILWSWCAVLCRLVPKSTFATVGLQLLAERVHMSMMDLPDEGKPPSPGTTCLNPFGYSVLIHRYRCATDSWYYAWLPGVISSGSCHSCQELKDSTKMCWASMKLLKRL